MRTRNVTSSKDSVNAAFFKWHFVIYELNALTDFVYQTSTFLAEDTSGISALLHLRVVKKREGFLRSLSLVKHQLSFIATADPRAKSRPAFQKRTAVDGVFYAL